MFSFDDASCTSRFANELTFFFLLPLQMEERGVDETIEQFEERLLNKRAGHLYSTIRMRISTGVTTTFNDLIIANPKKQVIFSNLSRKFILFDWIFIYNSIFVTGRAKILFFIGFEKT